MAEEYIKFKNNSQPALNDTNINEMQKMIREDLESGALVISSKEPEGNDRKNLWIQKTKNLFNGLELGGFDGEGNKVNNNIRLRSKDFIEAYPNENYAISMVEYNSQKGLPMVNIFFYNSNKQNIGNIGSWNYSPYIFSTPANCKYIKAIFRFSNSDTQVLTQNDITKVQTELGDETTQYENYIPNIKIYAKLSNEEYEKIFEIADNLNSESEKAALSANQGRILNDRFNYSTTEKVVGTWIDGKPIYRKIINIGNLPNANYSNVAHNINNLNKVIKIYGNATNGTLHLPLPFVSTVSISSNVGININGNYITINSGTDRSSFSGYAIIEYTKTTD